MLENIIIFKQPQDDSDDDYDETILHYWDTFHSLWAPNPNLGQIILLLCKNIRISSCHNFADDMTTELSWHVQNCERKKWLKIRKTSGHNFAHAMTAGPSWREIVITEI